MFRSVLLIAAGLVAAACTSTPQVPVMEPRDTHMSCVEITREADALKAVMAEAHRNKGFNVANFFAVPFFPPAYYNNVLEADNAEEWVQRRRVMLTDLYMHKGCAPGFAGSGAVNAVSRSTVDRQAVYNSALQRYNQ